MLRHTYPPRHIARRQSGENGRVQPNTAQPLPDRGSLPEKYTGSRQGWLEAADHFGEIADKVKPPECAWAIPQSQH
jgi:hypothetical protein